MCFSFGQVTLLQGRKSDINYQLNMLAMDKTTLTRQMSEVSRKYRSALSSKVMKLSNNNGLTYTDISYGVLMRPNTANNNEPIILADTAGKIVLDEKYKNYAEKISPNGASGGNWSGNKRLEILSALTGISQDKIETFEGNSEAALSAKKTMENAKKARDSVKRHNMTVENYISKYCNLSSFSGNVNPSNAASIASSAVAAFSSGYLPSSVTANLSEYCTEYAKGVQDNDPRTAQEFVKNMITAALGGSTLTVFIDNNKSTLAEYETKDAEYQASIKAYQDALGTSAGSLTAADEKNIEFYDQMFTAIADNGWSYDSGIEDNNYLNQMLQNGSYTFVNMTKSEKSETSSKAGYDYEFDVATNKSNIFTVNDTNAGEVALAEYETQKTIINEKEQRIDKKMNNLDTERAAIIKMIESCEKMGKDNIERTMKLWA